MMREWETDEWGRYVKDDHTDPFRQSRCAKGGYCDFEDMRHDDEVNKETCVKCGRRVVYLVKGGQIDNVRYLMEHAKNFAQRTGRSEKVYKEIHAK